MSHCSELEGSGQSIENSFGQHMQAAVLLDISKLWLLEMCLEPDLREVRNFVKQCHATLVTHDTFPSVLQMPWNSSSMHLIRVLNRHKVYASFFSTSRSGYLNYLSPGF